MSKERKSNITNNWPITINQMNMRPKIILAMIEIVQFTWTALIKEFYDLYILSIQFICHFSFVLIHSIINELFSLCFELIFIKRTLTTPIDLQDVLEFKFRGQNFTYLLLSNDFSPSIICSAVVV